MKKKSYALASALILAAIAAEAQTTPPAAPGPQAAATPAEAPATANISLRQTCGVRRGEWHG